MEESKGYTSLSLIPAHLSSIYKLIQSKQWTLYRWKHSGSTSLQFCYAVHKYNIRIISFIRACSISYCSILFKIYYLVHQYIYIYIHDISIFACMHIKSPTIHPPFVNQLYTSYNLSSPSISYRAAPFPPSSPSFLGKPRQQLHQVLYLRKGSAQPPWENPKYNRFSLNFGHYFVDILV